MNHDAVCVQLCRSAGLSDDKIVALLTRLAGISAGTTSDGSTASYYELPQGATELQHLISHRNMNAQVGEIFRACYRYGIVAHSPRPATLRRSSSMQKPNSSV
ncbi:hypothetical protein [Pararhodobacter sp.]|uniref:hypothetical protein n=1 Tax=Pararhodobacter sp. TaxID=2127056 RepID=UPI002B000040|nr:hypothetical protein [Pararhodobacter sp.]